ncbi:hypothetical protein J1N35_033234 [Gossypium stocksii]|uniref:Uncharacterized protein n=1 Tax=Gossypium stocksii TaxID=47602 RepID=A0A9D3UQJ7_9ROSI|nr:hypothetical protein J1N35_033234 [Gossypium stocksii]
MSFSSNPQTRPPSRPKKFRLRPLRYPWRVNERWNINSCHSGARSACGAEPRAPSALRKHVVWREVLT